METTGSTSDQPQIEVLGKVHYCSNWLPTAEKDKLDLVIVCVCGEVYRCYGVCGEYNWGGYGKKLVDTLDGSNVVVL